MSDLTFLVAESFLVVAGALSIISLSKLASDKWASIVTGVVLDIPVSPGTRQAMLFGMWLPYQSSVVALSAFLALTQLAMADHVTDANIRLVVYFSAFLAAVGAAFALFGVTTGLFSLRAKVRRDEQRQAQAD